MRKVIDSFRGQYEFLSNFFIDTEGYCVERHYQAAKCLKAEDAARILTLAPGAAKRAGRRVELVPNWNEKRLDVMMQLLRRKFQPLVMQELLLETGLATLIEGNFWGDYFWGMCRGVGENHLGKLLMQVRGELARKKRKSA